jgi:fructose-1,6-bisphosphatase-3
MYLVHNSNLLFHGCIPLNEDGSFKEVFIDGDYYKGKNLLEKYDSIAREAYFFKDNIVSQHKAMDLIWYLWCGTDSPQFGKDKMTTFERYFIADKKTHHEELGLYYTYRNKEEFAKKILVEFNLNPEKSHIINGHVPVKTIDGENAIKAGGRLIAIDGGFCKAYQPETGIAGYTLVHNSYGLLLISHEPFESIEKAINEDKDIISSAIILERTPMRKRVVDTDKGKEIQKSIKEIERLLIAYRNGLVKEPKAIKNN